MEGKVLNGNLLDRSQIVPSESFVYYNYDENRIYEFFIDKILDRYSYYFTREYLRSNKSLVYSIAVAIDRKDMQHDDPSIYYNGGRSILPNYYNNSNWFNESILSSLFGGGNSSVSASIIRAGAQHNICGLQLNEDEYDAITSAIGKMRSQDIPPQNFIYKGRVCRYSNLSQVPRTPQAFLSFERTNGHGNQRFRIGKNLAAIHKEIFLGRKTIIMDDVAQTLSGVPISYEYLLNRVIRDPLNMHPERVRALYEKLPYYVNAGNLFDTFTNERQSLRDAKNIILSFHGNLFAENNESSLLRGKSDNFIVDWAFGVGNSLELFTHRGRAYHREFAKSIGNGPITLSGNVFKNGWSAGVYSNLEGLRRYEASISQYSNRELIKLYHKYYPSQCGVYYVVDKKSGSLTIYNNDGESILKDSRGRDRALTIMLGKNKTDNRTVITGRRNNNTIITNNSSAAGIFRTGLKKDKHPYYDIFNGRLIALVNEKNSNINAREESNMAVHQIPNGLDYRYDFLQQFIQTGNTDLLRVSGGCLNLHRDDYTIFENSLRDEFHNLKLKCPFYVLPEEDKHKFVIEEGVLRFVPNSREQCDNRDTKNRCSTIYNYSPGGKFSQVNFDNVKEIKIGINPKVFEREFIDENVSDGKFDNMYKKTKRFVTSLEKNKKPILKVLNRYNKIKTQDLRLTQRQYDLMAKTAIGVLGIESDFCSGKKYQFKEIPLGGQISVSLMKPFRDFKNGEDAQWVWEYENSRGCTQIKNAKENYVRTYLLEKKGNKWIDTVPSELFYFGNKKLKWKNFGEGDLNSPEISAIVTMLVLFDIFNYQMKDRELAEILRLNDENVALSQFEDYFYYYYQGQNWQIKAGLATPSANVRIREIKNTLKYFHVYRKLTDETDIFFSDVDFQGVHLDDDFNKSDFEFLLERVLEESSTNVPDPVSGESCFSNYLNDWVAHCHGGDSICVDGTFKNKARHINEIRQVCPNF